MATPSLIRGAQNMDITSTQRKRSVMKEIIDIREPDAELLQLTMARYSKSKPNIVTVDSRKFEYNEKRLAPKTVTLVSISSLTLTFSDADCEFIRKGTILKSARGKTARVMLLPVYASNTCVIDADPGFANGDVLVLAGIAGAENDTLAPSYYVEPTLATNYIQEVNHAYRFSRWAGTEARYDGPIKNANERDMRLYHKIDCNRVLWMGRNNSGVDSASNAVLETRGILETIQTNVTNFDGGLVTFKALRTMVGDYTQKSPSLELDAYVSPSVWGLLDDLWFEKQSISAPIITKAGVAMRQISLGPKVLNIIQAVGFVGPFSDMLCVIDPAYFEIKTTKDQATGERQFMMEIRQGAAELNLQAEQITEVSDIGACLVAEEAHFIAENALAVA